MAEMPNSLVRELSCQVCFEEFKEDGDHVPRILPCHHTLCHTCIATMIALDRHNKIECPECREIHDAKNFPQNKYLLIHVRREEASRQEPPAPVDLCPEHTEKLNLFCREPGCQKPICSKCLTKYHKKHEFVDIEEAFIEKDLSIGNHSYLLHENIENVASDLSEKMAKVLEAKDECTEKNDKCINKLKKKKEDVDKEFDKMIKQAEDHMKEVDKRIDGHISEINNTLAFLMTIKENIEDNANEDMMDIIVGISEHVEENLSGIRQYSYQEYEESRTAVYGKITLQELAVNLSGQPSVQAEPSASQLVPTPSTSRAERTIDQQGPSNTMPQTQTITTVPLSQSTPNELGGAHSNISWLHCQVTHRRIPAFDIAGPIALLPDGNMVVYGKDNSGWKLKVFDKTSGQELKSIVLEFEPFGMAVVILGGRLTVVLAYSDQKKIQFRCANNLDLVICTYSTESCPGRLCATSPDTLLFVDRSKFKREVRWLNCAEAAPRPATGSDITEEDGIIDVCFVQSGDKQLRVTTRGVKGFDAYNTETNELEWSIRGKIQGFENSMFATDVTSDEHGNIFVCDGYSGNNCIHVFSVNGVHQRVLLREGDPSLGVPRFIRWSETTSSLIVGHWIDGKLSISVVTVL